jgi:hypothetical protein
MSRDTLPLPVPVPLHVVSAVVESIWTDHVDHIVEHHAAPQFWLVSTESGPAAVIDWPDAPEGWALAAFGPRRIDISGFWHFRNIPVGTVFAEAVTSSTALLYSGS